MPVLIYPKASYSRSSYVVFTIMKSRIVFAACVYLLYVSLCFASTGQESFDNGNYVANWTHNPETDKISVQVEVKTTGWVGFGFAEKAHTGMKDYDVAVGGVPNDNMIGYLVDCYTGEEAKPPADSQQDYNLTSAKRENGKTQLTFERKCDTGDNKDVQLKPGEGVYLVWAYQSSGVEENFSNLTKHSKKGTSAQKVVIVPKANSTVVSMTPSVANTPAKTTPATSSAAPTKPSQVKYIVVLAATLTYMFIYL